ncbi:MAG: NADH-quinone oxidoreductase subunit F [Firmicutes bacterium]|nr:NADH-quinone oxidoreductase subunit F [Bacillota bacterium]
MALATAGCYNPDSDLLQKVESLGLYKGLRKALGLSPGEILDEVARSGLRGRGGAGFTAAVKWEAALRSPGGPPYLVCNADEGAPGTFKDRVILEADPHRLIEGLLIAALALGSTEAFVYLNHGYALARRRLARVLEQAGAEGLLALPGRALKVSIFPAPGSYISGEETALLETIEGKRGVPRPRPPFPTESGLHGRPTVVQNVETLSCLPFIITGGAAAFRRLGTSGSPGTRVFSVSGDLMRPAVVEMPCGTTLRRVLEAAGAKPLPGRSWKFFLLGGAGGGILPASMDSIPLDFEAPARLGLSLGSGAILAFDDSRSAARAACQAAAFFAEESCGWCAPCRQGTAMQHAILEDMLAGSSRPEDGELLGAVIEALRLGSACGLGQAASRAVETARRAFPDEFPAGYGEADQ